MHLFGRLFTIAAENLLSNIKKLHFRVFSKLLYKVF